MKKDKKRKDVDVSFADGPPPGEGSDTEAANAKGDISASKKPAEIDPDDLLDEEFGSTKSKPKKGKKGKGKKVAQDEDEENEEAPETSEFCVSDHKGCLYADHAHDQHKPLRPQKSRSQNPRKRLLPPRRLRIQALSYYRKKKRRS